MLTLALDTTASVGSCALAVDGVVVSEQIGESSGGHAERLPQMLMRVLADGGSTLAQVELFAVTTGPGSFTGLRIGIATMQGLAFAAGKRLAGISGFDALATIAERDPRQCPIVTWVDAWRGEVYAARYEGGRQVESPSVEGPDKILARMSHDPTLFIGDAAGTYRDRIQTVLGPNAHIVEPSSPPLAGTIALLAEAAVDRGEPLSPHAIHPLYVRRTDAELARDARTRG